MSRKIRYGLFAIAFSLLFLSVVLLIISRDIFYSQCNILPENSTAGPLNIGGLTISEAMEEIKTLSSIPLELKYQESLIQVNPEQFSFKIDIEKAQSELESKTSEMCSSKTFLNSLFREQKREPISIALESNADEEKIESFLRNEISARYDQPAAAKYPDLNGSGFYSGHPGYQLDIKKAVKMIQEALTSFDHQTIDLPIISIPEPPSSLTNLEILLSSVVDQNQDPDQITEIYLLDPKTGEEFDFARQNKSNLIPEIAFTAASTIKIPIMISAFKHLDEKPSAVVSRQLELMITESKNEQTDWLLENVIGGETAPLEVTKDIRALGFQNTFLAGYFYLGAPLLDRIETPANTRTDIDLKPDIYNQTTPKDIGLLLYLIYQCDLYGKGKLTEVFPNEITQSECSDMMILLKNNHLPYLISAGIPDGIPIAHKHGWIEESDGLLHTMSNVAAVYSPGGDYILSIYTYHPQNLIFEKGNILFSRISSAVYGFFNPQQNDTVN